MRKVSILKTKLRFFTTLLVLGVSCSSETTENLDTPALDAGVVADDAASESDASVITDAGMPEDAMASGPNSPNGSEGCGVEQVPPSGVYEIEVDGTTREYHIVVPENYDPETGHKLIFVWHGLGGEAEREVRRNFFGLGNQNDGSAIFVAGQGLARMGPNGMARTGWSNRNGG